ncbi:MAG: hypothetical protein HQL36_02180 [Alphaproteobacteria bacterium]|nr:hypothetical protein [Alphaproteobacteria bacterium]
MGRMLELLREGDRRTTAGSAEAARWARVNPRDAAELVDLLAYRIAAVRMRAADALEKASAQNTALLAPYKALLLDLAEDTMQPELRWHLAQLLPRLDLDAEEVRDAASLFLRWYKRDSSAVVRTFVLQGLMDLTRQDHGLLAETEAVTIQALASPTPSLKARARKVKLELDRLKADPGD